MLATPATPDRRDAAFFEAIREAASPGRRSSTSPCSGRPRRWPSGLHAAGFPARPYHAGMEDADREEIQNWFIASDRGIVVATIAFGMGIDKADVRYVYHYNPPKSLENYAQEIGRAGRDGRPSVCEMFFCPDDLNVLENFVYGDTPTADAVEGLVREIFANDAEFDVSEYELSSDARHSLHGGPHVADVPGTRRPPGTRHAVLRHVSIQAAEDVGRDLGAFRRRAQEVSGRFVPAGEEGKDLVPTRRRRGEPDARPAARSRGPGARLSGRARAPGTARSPACGTGSSCSDRPDNLAALAQIVARKVAATRSSGRSPDSAKWPRWSNTTAARCRPSAAISATRCRSRAATVPGVCRAASPAACRRGPSRGSTRRHGRRAWRCDGNTPTNSAIPVRWPDSCAASRRPTWFGPSSKSTRCSAS